MARLNIHCFNNGSAIEMKIDCKIAVIVDEKKGDVRISFLNQDDKAFGYVQYGFDEMPLVQETSSLKE